MTTHASKLRLYPAPTATSPTPPPNPAPNAVQETVRNTLRVQGQQAALWCIHDSRVDAKRPDGRWANPRLRWKMMWRRYRAQRALGLREQTRWMPCYDALADWCEGLEHDKRKAHRPVSWRTTHYLSPKSDLHIRLFRAGQRWDFDAYRRRYACRSRRAPHGLGEESYDGWWGGPNDFLDWLSRSATIEEEGEAERFAALIRSEFDAAVSALARPYALIRRRGRKCMTGAQSQRARKHLHEAAAALGAAEAVALGEDDTPTPQDTP